MSRPLLKPDVFHAVADPTRRAILDHLRRGESSAGQISRLFKISQPACSQHLRVLRRVRLVRQRRDGRRRLYRLNAEPLVSIFDWISPYERFWRVKLEALGRHLERNP
jgi:DNA-binding transcriptional ArsR family regulator